MHAHRLRLFLVVLLAALTGPAAYAEKIPFVEPRGLIIELNGGDVTKNLARVLNLLVKSGVKLPAGEVVMKEGESVCSVLASQGYPPPCEALLPIVEMLNPGLGKGLDKIGVDDKINVPELSFTGRRLTKLLYKKLDTEKYLQQILENWKYSNIILRNKLQDDYSIQFDYTQFRAFIPVSDIDLLAVVYKDLRVSGIPNTAFRVRGKGISVIKLNTAPDKGVLLAQCSSGVMWDEYDYLSAFDNDRDAGSVFKEKRNQLSGHDQVKVHMFDTSLNAAWNLPFNFRSVLVNPILTKSCKWIPFDKRKHHANLIASIIASKKNTGFQGIWPSIKLRAFVLYDGEDDVNQDFTSYLVNRASSSDDVLVFASGINFTSEEYYTTDDGRDAGSEAEIIKTLDNLIVAAAPTTEQPDEPGVALDQRNGIFPQNFGDLGNVIVVSACTKCNRNDVELLPNAARSTDNGSVKFVHVAAPGGEVTSWIGSDSLSNTIGGTSEAAAYVAGVAAAMISVYPRVYTKPFIIKYRLQVCSYPLRRFVNRSPNPELGKLAAGVIDPDVCMLDPNKTWVKDGGKWRAVDFKGWSANSKIGNVPLDRVMRIVRMPGRTPNRQEWRVYSEREKYESRAANPTVAYGAINQDYDVKISNKTKIFTCDTDTPIDMSSVTDLIFPHFKATNVCSGEPDD